MKEDTKLMRAEQSPEEEPIDFDVLTCHHALIHNPFQWGEDAETC